VRSPVLLTAQPLLTGCGSDSAFRVAHGPTSPCQARFRFGFPCCSRPNRFLPVAAQIRLSVLFTGQPLLTSRGSDGAFRVVHGPTASYRLRLRFGFPCCLRPNRFLPVAALIRLSVLLTGQHLLARRGSDSAFRGVHGQTAPYQSRLRFGFPCCSPNRSLPVAAQIGWVGMVRRLAGCRGASGAWFAGSGRACPARGFRR
jgi:hypothetical protein